MQNLMMRILKGDRYSKKIMIDIKSIEEFVDKDGYDIETTN